MARTARLVIPGLPHHISHRGHRGQDVFLSDRERQRYLAWLAQASSQHDLRVWAYCLMGNHVHLVAVPGQAQAMSRVVGIVHTKHAQAMNAEHGWEGNLWHSRYFSCPMDPSHLWEAVRYVERNPVRAGLVQHAEEYPWSSAAPHSGRREDPVLSGDLPLLQAVDDWAVWLRDEEDEAVLSRIRRCTVKGRAYGEAVRA